MSRKIYKPWPLGGIPSSRVGIEGLGQHHSSIEEWETLQSHQGCVFDYIGSSAILEWLCRQKILKMHGEPDARFLDITQSIGENHPDVRFQRYRTFSNFVSSETLMHQLLFYEKLYLNIGTYYREYTDLDALKKYGFIEEYLFPSHNSFFDAYRLIHSLAVPRLTELLRTYIHVPYEELWEDKETGQALQDYSGLANWLYIEWAKDICDIPCDPLDLIGRMKGQYVHSILDLTEYAVHAQGNLAAGNLPMFSSILCPRVNNTSENFMPETLRRDDVLALYQRASKDVMGYYVAIDSFDDLLRLRDDKRVIKVRELLMQYQQAMRMSKEEIVGEISREIFAAKQGLSVMNFTENPVWSFVIKPALSFIPVVGTVIGIVDVATDLAQAWLKRKYGWIYFGSK